MKKANATIAIPPKGKYMDLTAGKEYPIIHWNDKFRNFSIKDDVNVTLEVCLPKGCLHIHCKNWILK